MHPTLQVGNPTSGSVPVEMTNWKRSNLTSSSDGAHHQPGLVLQAFNGGGGSKQPVFSLANPEEYCLELLKNHKAPIYVTWPVFCVTVGSSLPPEAGWWKTPSGP